ncbi:cyclin-dependent kinase inhibitor 1Ba [Mastacembelus armatus]|uniref:cyclin-dependent kinase inhibitor 1Ba n=1 Tax=Mastacembelus armatus TaxID=205130 RepID=UPI000E462ADC|nr:cyclin-dependent kinase inhibitor 1B-like [Mastacembelus armatus]
MCNKMSDVRLSNASPTVERVDARQPENVRPPVCRNLFGTPDREENRRILTDSIQDGVAAFMETYNFDPVNDRPLSPGSYDWQEDQDPPEFYLRAPHGTQQVAEGRSEEHSDRQPARNGSRKRRSGDLGSCSDESQSKRSRTDDDHDEDQSDGAGSQALSVAEEERRSSSQPGAEVQ